MEGHPPGRLNWVTEPRQLAANVGLSGPIPRRASSARRGPFFLDLAGERPDPLDDDLALWIRTGSGLVVVVGCCHAGVLDTLSHVEALTGGARLRALIGGLHLADASDEEIERAAAALQERDPELVVPCHCTGQRAVDALRRVLGDRVAAGAAGTTFAFGEDTPATTSERA